MEEKVIRYVQKQTKQPPDAVRRSLDAAARRGISPEEYVRFCCWEMSDSELTELTELLGQVHSRRKQDEEWFLRLAHRRSLRPIASLRKEMDRFKDLGMAPLIYVKHGYYFPFRTKRGLKKARERGKRLPKKDVYFQKIRQITGWSGARTELEVTKAWLLCGADYEDYYRSRMYERTAREQAACLTYDHFEKMSVFYNHFFTKALVNTKSVFNLIFSGQIKRRWFLNRHLSYPRFLKKIRGLDAVLVKPVSSTHGKGIQKIQCDVPDKKALYDTVMALPKSVVEEYIVQHPDMAAFCDTSVNTLRVVTLNDHGTCALLFALLRMGRGAIVDNVHSGGIAAAVDVKTGIISSDAVDAEGAVYPVHPCSGHPIKGTQIPNWDAVTELCKKCYNRIPGVRLIGWDIAVTSDGAELIEGNTSPAFATIQAIALREGNGMRAEVFDAHFPRL